ncbi:PAS domain S-box protein [Hansschlegelia plantiphila]|uniref:histidine kinase n=1 Tax=Hansschlegelia plantiphila TaxID=374655 RepID=A0A9W6IXX4_9HYPH|nr:PAS domain S-box protein [Hansschlegelia plantiphila]GLK67200.1 PAS domain-containing sensor histidine kinase [Hansschlegelia plantiphila]
MPLEDLSDAFAAHPALDALAGAATPAIVVDSAGAVLWANRTGRSLTGEGGFDDAALNAVNRIAATGAEGLARLRVGRGAHPQAMTFRSSNIHVGEHRGALIQALEPLPQLMMSAAAEVLDVVRPDPEPGPSEATPDEPAEFGVGPDAPAADVAPDPAPEAGVIDAAAEEGALPLPATLDAPEGPSAEVAGGDEPPDPRRAAGASSLHAEAPPEEAAVPTPTAEAASKEERPRDLLFVFEIDAHGRLVFLSPDLAERVGPSAKAAVGRLWSELADDFALDPSGVVAARLQATDAWSDVEIFWPTERGDRLPLSVSALPIFDRGRTFIGFRGLGRSLETPLEPFKPENPTSDRDPAPETVDPAEVDLAGRLFLDPTADALREEAADALFDESLHDDRGGDAGRPRSEPLPIFSAPDVVEKFHGNVVALREGAPSLRQPAGLSIVEETAFDEIARRLREVRPPEEPTDGTVDAVPPDHSEAAGVVALDRSVDGVEGRDPVSSLVDDLTRLLDKLPIGVLVLRAGEIAHANRAALEMLGHPNLQSLISRGADDLFAEAPAHDDAAPSTRKIVARDGLEVEVEAKLSPIAWRGAPATLVSLKRAEGATATAALQREKEIAEILDTATDGVMTLDSDGRVLSVNRSAEALFGFDAREVIGSLFTLSLAPESRRAAFDYLDTLRDGGVASVMNDGREVLGLARQGGAIPLYLTIGRIGPAQSGRYCAVLRDITHWKKAEEELLAAKRQAERANAQKSEFLARVSREIRTPLNAIIGFAEVMMEERFGPVGSPRYKDYLRDIHLSGGHLIGLVNDLIDLARVESGRLKLDFTSLDLNEIVSQAAALLQPQANREHVIIRTSLARNLPQVMADRRSVRQILANLLSNAVKFSRPGGQVIVATAFSDLGQAVIRVRDAGVGMSRKQIAQAIEPFRPLQDVESDPGAGLGLPLTKALSEANEALFSIQSEIGEGTLVEITFPASRVIAS